MKTVICRLDLGYTRVAGYTLYDDITEEFHETTPREVKELIKNDQVNGLKLVNDEIVLDVEGFNQRNLMIKSAVGKYRPLYNTDSLVTRMYAVLDVVDCGGEFKYEVITNYCGRKLMTEEFVRTLSSIGYVAGVIITDKKIILCNKKLSNHLISGKPIVNENKDEEYKEINELPEADAVLIIEEEVKIEKEIIKENEGTEVKVEVEPEVKAESNVEMAVDKVDKTHNAGEKASNDKGKAEKEKVVTHKSRSREKK